MKAIIVHRWDGTPNSDWYPWLKKELETQNFEVSVPEMPETNNPTIEKWVHHLSSYLEDADDDTFLVGHSIGCQTILRCLERFEDKRVGGVLFVAGWVTLSEEVTSSPVESKIAAPWLNQPILFEDLHHRSKHYVSIFSEDDPFVPMDENSSIFKEKLGSKIVIDPGKGHFTEDDGITELPSALESIIKFTKE